MKRTQLIAILFFVTMVFMLFKSQPANSHTSGAPAGKTNSPADNSNCTSCHNGSASAATGIITSNVPLSGYVPGTVYTITASVGDSSISKFGFEISPQNNSGALQGSLTITNSTQTQIVSSKYVTHKTAGTGTTPYHNKQWSFNWTAPAAGTGAVTFYGSFLFTNSQNNSSGDVTKTSTLVIQESVPTPSVSITITSGSNPICEGGSVTFTATPANGGTSPSYQWKINGNPVATGITFTTTSLTNGQIVTCDMTAPGGTVTSNGIVMTVNPVLTPSVSIAATSATTLCAGQTFTFSATPTNGGSSPVYQWKVNGSNAGTGANFSSAGLNSNSVVTCVLTSNATCASPTTATSNSISVTVNPLVTPTISIASANTNVCVGQSVSFTSSITNGGNSPTYQWKVNGNNAGTGSSFASSSLNNNDVVSCILTSNANCTTASTANSNTITVTVNPIVTPTIVINTPSTNICSGQTVSFTSSVTNGGGIPAYQWKVNGNNVATGSGFSSVLNNNDTVMCVLTSTANCVSNATVNSNTIVITTGTNVVPAVSIAADNVSACEGTTVHLTATPANGGSSPSFQWKVNGNNAATGSTFSSIFNNGDTVNCVMTSNSSCVTVPTAVSNTLTLTINTPPVVTVLPSVNVSFCENDSVLLTANGANTYLWSNSATGASVWVNTAGNYTVTAIDNNLCTAVSTPVAVTVNPLPIATITQIGDTLVASLANSYLWFKDGNTIGNTESIIATQTGNYSVRVTDVNGCSALSSEVNVVVASVLEEYDLSVKVYPVPNNGNFTVQLPQGKTAELSVANVYGQLVFTKPILSTEIINAERLAPQIYFVTLRSGRKMKTIKMQVQ